MWKVLVSVILLSGCVSGLPLTFTTSGTFGNVPASCFGNGSSAVTCLGGTQQIAFHGVQFSAEPPLSGRFDVSLGSFSFLGIATNSLFGNLLPDGITFSLLVEQTSPSSGQTTFPGIIHVVIDGVGAHNELNMFTPQTQSIGVVEYSLAGMFIPANSDFPSRELVVPELSTARLMFFGLFLLWLSVLPLGPVAKAARAKILATR